MHLRAFRVGISALLGVIGLMVAFELAVALGAADRDAVVDAWVQWLGTLMLWVAVIAGFLLLPQAWRQYLEVRDSMERDRRHAWFLIMVFGLSAAGYLGYYYLRKASREQ